MVSSNAALNPSVATAAFIDLNSRLPKSFPTTPSATPMPMPILLFNAGRIVKKPDLSVESTKPLRMPSLLNRFNAGVKRFFCVGRLGAIPRTAFCG
jgi:hypothetical protein